MKLELAAGHRPTRGYEHNDLYPFDHIEHVGDPWMLELPDESCEEVLALAFIEHLTFDQARDTMRNVYRILRPGGMFLFDVPDYPVWAGYYLKQLGNPTPYTSMPSLEHCRRTLFGWQRWPGDEHKSGWDKQLVVDYLKDAGFRIVNFGVEPFIERTYRQRFANPVDAHIYLRAIK